MKVVNAFHSYPRQVLGAMTWGNQIRIPFAAAYFHTPTPSSFEFHAGYNALLNHLWADSMFLLNPHFVTSKNPTFWFEVVRVSEDHGFIPVFFLEVRSPSDLESMEKRERADMQTRARMAQLVSTYYLSSKLCFQAHPPVLCRENSSENDVWG